VSIFLTRLFLFLALAGFWLPAVPAYAGSEYTEQMLATRAYPVPPGADVLTWLTQLVEATVTDTLRHPENAAENHLILGDAYHWIGHIHEDRREFQIAWEMHLKSFAEYAQSPLQHSAYITNLKTLDHAKVHLTKMAPLVHLPLPTEVRAFKPAPVAPFNPLKEIPAYQARIQAILQTVPQCRSLF
jgi:hypothetical protein